MLKMRLLGPRTTNLRSFFSTQAGFKFDFLPDALSISNDSEKELDEAAMSSLNQLKLPKGIIKKMENLLKSYGSKQDLENIGMYISRKLHSRSSVELPRVLHSSRLPMGNSDTNVAKSLMKSIGSEDDFSQDELPRDSNIYLEAISRAEDARHKLFKMTYFPEAALALMGQRFSGMYASHYRIFSEIRKRAPKFNPKSMMEYNAKFAPGILAANMIWKNEFVDALAIENSENLSNIGQYLCQDIPYVRWQYNIYENTQNFDLISCNYSMCDLSNIQSRQMLIRNLWNRLAINGMLVLVEPGTPTGFRNIFTIRELFLSELSTEKFHFLAPCPHEDVCPMALTGKDWCHFSQRINQFPKHLYTKSRERTAVNFEDEKFSFIVIVKGKGPRYIYKNEQNAPDAVNKSYFWPRIVMPVIKRGRHVLIDTCSLPHNFERLIVTKDSPKIAGYRFARKALWGDLWRFHKRLNRYEARDYTPDEVKRHFRALTEKTLKSTNPKERVPQDIVKEVESKMIQDFGK